MMRTAVIGGTFDPVHIGHLHLADELILQAGFERVLFVPTNLPPHKSVSNAATSRQRLEMLEEALCDFPRYCVDAVEIERGGISYTVETIPQLMKRHDITGKPGLVIGDDLVAGFPEWRDYRALLEMVELVIAHRTSAEEVSLDYPHRYVDNLMLPISSSDIRRRIRDHKAYRHIVPESVFRYIESHTLYHGEE
jgi:nicotinate-nucleotide adenylyltransferase